MAKAEKNGFQREEKEEKWAKHYSSNHEILLVGEGDLSFALSLALTFGSASNIVATSLDSYGVVINKYKKAKSNLEMLEKLGASLLHEVDATMMKLHTDLQMVKFDRIIYNFPHAGFHGKENNVILIKMHRNLVCGFFRNASGMLRTNGEIHVNHKTTPPFCCWNLEELACQNFLALVECADFRKEDYPGYNNKRGAGDRCDDPFSLGKSSTFQFVLSSSAQKKTSRSKKNLKFSPCKNHHQIQDIPIHMLQQPPTQPLQDDVIHVNHKMTSPFGHWNLKEHASQSSLALVECVDFNKEDYPGYNTKRGADDRCGDPFPLGEFSTFKFVFSSTAKKMATSKWNLASPYEEPHQLQDVNYAPVWSPPGNEYYRVCNAYNPQHVQEIPIHMLPQPNSLVNQSVVMNNGSGSATGIRKECYRIFTEYLNHAVESFGEIDYDLCHTVDEDLRIGFERLKAENPGKPVFNDYINLLEEIRVLSSSRSAFLRTLLLDNDHQLLTERE